MKLTNFVAAGLTATLMTTSFAYAQSAPAPASEIQMVVKNEAIAAIPEVVALIEDLKAQGYTYFEIRRTLLGRAKVIAQNGETIREIVMSANTGEVLRDVMRTDEGPMGNGPQAGGGAHFGGNSGGMTGGMTGGMGGNSGSMSGGMSGGMGGN